MTPRIRRYAVLPVLFAALLAAVVACNRSSPTAPCEGPYQVGGDVLSPIKIYAPQPQYNEEARRAGVQGAVIVQATIDCEGYVRNVRVLQGLPLGLTEATVAAITQWRFSPATRNGRPVMVFYNLTVNFRLQ